MPMFTGNTPLMMYCLRRKIRQNEFEASLSFLFSRVFQNTHIAFSWSFYTRTSEPCLYMMPPRPPLFHKITTPRPHTHKKRSQMIPSSIRKNVQQNKYKFLFHVFFKKAASLMLLLYYYYTLYQYRKWNYFFSSLPVKHNLLRALSTFAYFSICKTANLLDTMCLLKS